jgi:excisionase family DNA binding protein
MTSQILSTVSPPTWSRPVCGLPPHYMPVLASPLTGSSGKDCNQRAGANRTPPASELVREPLRPRYLSPTPDTRAPSLEEQAMKPDRRNASEQRIAELLLSVAEVRAWLNVSSKTVYRRIEDGTLAAVRVGKLFRIPVSSVTAMLDHQPSSIESQSNPKTIKSTRPSGLTTSPDN